MYPLINSDKSVKKRDWVFMMRSGFSLDSIFTINPLDATVQRGDVVALVSPRDPSERLIKRVIGLPGDVVKTYKYKKKYMVVPEGHCWVEGDNYALSDDSNRFGPVSMGLFQGKCKLIVHFNPIYSRFYYPSFKTIENGLPEHRKLRHVSKSANETVNLIDFKSEEDEQEEDSDDDVIFSDQDD